MVKKTSKTKHLSKNKTHILIKRSIVSYAVLVFLLFALTSMSLYLIDRLIAAKEVAQRRDEITSIYTSFNLDGEKYRAAKTDIFGDKRTYEWDSGRTYSSSVEYGYNDTPENTRAALKAQIEKAGFIFTNTVYEGSVSPQDHYKNSENQYVRVSVTPKAWQDAITYGTPKIDELSGLDKNAAPTYVVIKVNLDDNNE